LVLGVLIYCKQIAKIIRGQPGFDIRTITFALELKFTHGTTE
jgi:hypothetical protein